MANARTRQTREKRERDAAYWEAREKEEAEKNAKYRGLPASYRSFDELIGCVGETTANAIKEYVSDRIDEALHPDRDD